MRQRQTLSSKSPFSTLIALLCLCQVALAQEVIPDFYQDPGTNPFKGQLSQTQNENIDPFSGNLSRQYVDIDLPGNGGFDLQVVRSYNSTSVDAYQAVAHDSLMGLGWNLHFGRVLKTKDNAVCTNKNALTVADNPVLETAGGGRQLLAFTGSAAPLMLTTQRWKADCSSSSTGGLIVYSPDGIRYDMTQAVMVGSAAAPVWAFYTTKITDRNGNFATIKYASSTSPEITSVTASDGRLISFTYLDSGKEARRISQISAHGKIFKYTYTAVSGVTAKYQLTQVTRPDNTTWRYVYNAKLEPAAGSFLMNRATNPQGGYTSYTYGFVYFDAQANPASKTEVVSKKTLSTGGTWTFTYTPGNSTTYDVTTIATPSGTLTYKHIGPNNTGAGTVWKAGLLVEKRIGSNHIETLTWDKQRISTENYFRPGAFVLKVDTGATNAPILTKRVIQRDGATYTTNYSNFDAYGNPLTVSETGVNGGSRTSTMAYLVNTSKWIIKEPRSQTFTGSSWSRVFDANGNATQVTEDGVSTSFTYDASGNISSTTFPRGLIHNYSQYKRGIPQTESQPLGISLQRTVDDLGNVTTEINGEGQVTAYSYDKLDRVTLLNLPIGNDTVTTYTATSKQSTRGGLVEVTTFNGLGLPSRITLGGIGTNFTYDALGRKTFESNPGVTTGTTYAYDILDRPIKVTFADGKFQSIAYGAGTKTVTDELGFKTTYRYRAYGDPDQQILMSVTAPEASASFTLARNSKDLITSVVQDGLTRSYAYDTRYYLTSVTNPETGITLYGRDAAGNMTTSKVGASATTTYVYDAQNRLTSVVYPGTTPGITNTYNKLHKLLTSNTSAGKRSFTYDGNGNLKTETVTVGTSVLTTSYGYNANDQMASITYPKSGLVVQYVPDVLGRPTQASGFVNSVSYWPSGQVKQIVYANGTTTDYGQNSRLWPSTFTTRKTSTGQVYLNNSYAYNGAGYLTSISDTVDTSFNRTLTYDRVGRLTGATGPWGAGSIVYDGDGNITRQTLGSMSLTYAYDSANRLSALSGSKTSAFTYDAYGNIVSGYGNTFTYDDSPNLRCFNCAKTNKVEYAYDGSNKRVSVTKSGIVTYEFFGANENLLAEHTPAQGNKLVNNIYLGNQRVAQRTTQTGVTTKTTYFHNDLSGTPAMATDQASALSWKENYRPYGDRMNYALASADNGIWFAGKPNDIETGLSYMGARYYDPIIGRFMGIDPKGFDEGNLHSFNRYSYANNNPYRHVDPDGNSPIDVAFLVYDLGKLGVALYKGEGVDAALADVGASVVGVASPIPGAGQAIKAARTVNKVVDKASEVTNRAGQLAANKAAGKAAEAQAAKDLVAEGSTILGSQVSVRTAEGRRVIDHLVQDANGTIRAVEVKAGGAVRNATQIAKDNALATQGGTLVGKNAPAALRGQNMVIETVERRY